MKLTLLQQKNRPIHKLRPRGKSVVAFTYCGVEPTRRGVRTEGVNVGQMKATCKHCLELEAKENAKMLKIYSTKYVYSTDVLPQSITELLNKSDLPWSFGDCALSLIRPAQLLEWLEEQGDEVSADDFEAVKKTLAIDRDVLIAL